MVKVYSLKVGNVKVKYAHHTHKILGKYTSVGVRKGKGKEIGFIAPRLHRKEVISFVKQGAKHQGKRTI